MTNAQQAKYNLTQSALSLSNAISAGASVSIISRLQAQLLVAQELFNEVA